MSPRQSSRREFQNATALTLLVAICLSLFYIALALYPPAATSRRLSPVDSTDPFRGALTTPGPLLLDVPIPIELELRPLIDVSGARIVLLLPEALEPLDGQTMWQANLSRDVVSRFRTFVRTTESGRHTVQAFVRASEEDSTAIETYILPLHVAGSVPLPPVTSKISVEPDAMSEIQMDPIAEDKKDATAPGTITVRGAFRYRDNFSALKPVAYARVELVDGGNLLGDRHIAWSQTAADGSFYFDKGDDGRPIDNSDGFLSGTLDIKVKVYAENDAVKVSTNVVANVLGISYFAETPLHSNVADGDTNVGTYTSTGDRRGAWHIFGVVTDEWSWVKARTGWNRDQVGVHWPTGDWPVFQPWFFGFNYIVIPEGWEWDRPTVLHEYAHSIT